MKDVEVFRSERFSGEKRLSVAHRDVSSRNILVKADLTCCLCDLGFAIQMEGAHYFYQGEQQHAETTSLSDVSPGHF